jgi:hypothetical protein
MRTANFKAQKKFPAHVSGSFLSLLSLFKIKIKVGL